VIRGTPYRYETPASKNPTRKKSPRPSNLRATNSRKTKKPHLSSHVNAHSYTQPRLSTPHLAPSNSRLYLLAPRTHQLAPRATNPAATNHEVRSYHPALSISQLAATYRAIKFLHTLTGIFLSPTAPRPPSRAYLHARTSSWLPIRSYHLAATGCRRRRVPTLPSRDHHPGPPLPATTKSRPAATISGEPLGPDHLAPTASHLHPRASHLPYRVSYLTAQVRFTAAPLVYAAASPIVTRRYQNQSPGENIFPRASHLTTRRIRNSTRPPPRYY
jgi:hypothetical protein